MPPEGGEAGEDDEEGAGGNDRSGVPGWPNKAVKITGRCTLNAGRQSSRQPKITHSFGLAAWISCHIP